MSNHINVVKDVSYLCLVSYGFYYITQDIFSNFAWSLCLISTVIALPYLVRIPAPPKELVEQILGKDLHEAPENYRDVTMRSVGHRGVALDAPENSLEGFNLCSDNGMKFVEFDVMLTKDDDPVDIHDVNQERIADLPDEISEMTYQTLLEIDIGKKHAYGNKYTNIRIPTLDATLNQLFSSGQNMFIDLKCYNYNIVDLVIKLFQDYPELHSRAVITTFSPLTIYQIRKADPKIVSCVGWRPMLFQQLFCPCSCNNPLKYFKQSWASVLDKVYDWALGSFVYYLIGISAILIRKDVISERTITEWQQRNVRVIAWTVNSRLEKQYFAHILRVPYLTDTLTAEQSTHTTQNSL